MTKNVLHPVPASQTDTAHSDSLTTQFPTAERALEAALKLSRPIRKRRAGKKVGHLEGHMNLAQAVVYFGVSQKTLERWHAAKKGPKRIIHKSCVYYSHREIARWRDSLLSANVLHPVATERKS